MFEAFGIEKRSPYFPFIHYLSQSHSQLQKYSCTSPGQICSGPKRRDEPKNAVLRNARLEAPRGALEKPDVCQPHEHRDRLVSLLVQAG